MADNGWDCCCKAPHYVVSTSEDGDSISLWRGYAKLHDGYAIALKSAHLDLSEEVRVLPLVYASSTQTEMSKLIFDVTSSVYSQVETKDRKQVIINAMVALQFAIYSFKDRSFSGESEWRIVTQRDTDEECFRVAGGQIVPYVKIPLNLGDIGHIVQDRETIARQVALLSRGLRKCTASMA